MTDALDSLPDSALNELFAVEVEGCHLNRELAYGWTDPHGNLRATCDWPYGYTADANAVLLWLEKHQNALPCWISGSWQTTISKEVGEGETFDVVTLGEAEAPTFARAAALALIRATRASKSAST